MNSEQTGNTSLMAVLSILAILAISLVGGLLLMQKEEGSKSESGNIISSNVDPPPDEFDPISWAREGAEYPPLAREEDDDFVADYAGAVSDDEDSESTAVLETQEVAVVVPEKPAYQEKVTREEVTQDAPRKVRENMYWVQVVATETIANAERVRDELADMGLPVQVFTKSENGSLIYRVRLGPFSHKSEAENSVSVMHGIDDFADSYVTIAPVTIYIEN